MEDDNTTEQSSVEEALRLHATRLEALLHLSQMDDAPPQEITDFALEEAIKLTRSQIGYLAFANDDESVLTTHSPARSALEGCGIVDGQTEYPLETAGLWGEALRQRRPIITNDYAAPNPLKRGLPEGHIALQRHLNVPVFDGERIVAIAGVGNKNSDYDETDVLQLTLLLQGMWQLLKRKETTQALERSGALYRALFEQANDAIFLESEEEVILDANQHASELTGYSRQELVTMKTSDLQPSELRDRPVATSGRFETELLRRDGTRIPVDITLAPIEGDDRRRYLSIVRDISERVRAENRLRESQRTLATLMSNLPGMAYRCRNDRDWTMEFVSEGCKALTGYEPAALLHNQSLSFASLVHPEDQEALWESVQAGLRARQPFTMVYRITTAEGQPKWVWEAGQGVYSSQGELLALEGFITDITESRLATDALRQSEERFRSLFEDSPIALFEQDFSVVRSRLRALRDLDVSDFRSYFAQHPEEVARCVGMITVHDVNRAAITLYGASSKADLMGSLGQIMTEDAYPHFAAHLSAIAQGEGAYNGESINRRLDGTRIHINVRWSIAPGHEETWSRVFVSIIDTTERVLAEQARQESQQLVQRTISSLPDAVFILNQNVEVIECNPAATEIFGYPREEMLGFIGSLLHVNDEEHERFKRLIYQATDEGRILDGVQFPMRRQDGTVFPAERSVIPLDDGAGRTIGWVSIVRDLTERKRLEQELLKIEKLESVGVLAGGIAHDFNNLLTGILGNIALAKLYVPPAGEILEILSEAESASLRAKDLTHQLLTFSTGGAPIKKVSSISTLLVDTTVFALRGSNVRSQFVIAEDLWPVEVDENQFSQVIHNLVINADQAMPDGGILEVHVSNAWVTAGEGLPLPAGRYVQISVRDHGIGMPADLFTRIFDPYFTTKQKGSGLGLATAYSIVKAHAGHITVESEVGKGSVFYIFMPASDVEMQEADEEQAPAGTAQTGKILIMDDEEVVRKTAGGILRRLGYEVETAADGEQAVELYRAALVTGHPFDGVIMDLTIPGGMGGRVTIARLQRIDPTVRAVVSSGYSNDPIMGDFRAHGFVGVVVKPYSVEELQEAVQRMLMEET